MDHVMSEELAELLVTVLNLPFGDTFALREPGMFPSTVHRYEDGWMILIDNLTDRIGFPKAVLGWHFYYHEDLVDFLLGRLGKRHANFALVGERL